MESFRGTIRVDGRTVEGADVFLLDSRCKVVAATRSNGFGVWELDAPGGYAGGWLLAKLTQPVTGCRAVSVGATGSDEMDFAIAATDAAVLSGDLVPPDGVKIDWVEVHVTPRRIPGLPDEAKLALVQVGAGPEIKGTYYTRTVRQPAFRFDLLPGTWELRAYRAVEGEPVAGRATPNLEAAEVTLSNGAKPTPNFGGWMFDVSGDLHATVKLKVSEE
jgi:hypothetical protein